jgi:hypothetical protein
MRGIPQFLGFLLVLIVPIEALLSQQPWECRTYPDSAGFEQRIAPMLTRIAARGYGKISLAESRCPDTGLLVKTWAVKGETIISPYTGRAYQQGETGYFGPKARDEGGEIIAFGGDPLKYDLPPATAALLLNHDDRLAKAFLSIPGNLNQQYHFACKNWARFFPLLADTMGDLWKSRFFLSVANYFESRRPSDNEREWLPLSVPHNLVGEPGFLLGGNPLDGGTENHKIMWRTSCLLYSQLFPDTCLISGYPVKKAEAMVKNMLFDFAHRLLVTGNGEYDSQIYYPHCIEAYLNLYDFSPDPKTRELAKFLLDYYFATYGLKAINGIIAGAQKRGYLSGWKSDEMEMMEWAFFNDARPGLDSGCLNIHQTTTSYRPNKIIWNISRKNLLLPFEARMSRPFYHMDHAHAFAETFYCSHSFALGSVQMTIVDNPNQQLVWSLVARSEKGPLCFSGGQPLRGSTSGHSPYTQVLQSKGTLILLTAPTHKIENADTTIAPGFLKKVHANLWHLPETEQGLNFEVRNRQKYAAAELKPFVELPGNSASELEKFWSDNKGSACSWFYYPKQLTPQLIDGRFYFQVGDLFIVVVPLTQRYRIVSPRIEDTEQVSEDVHHFFSDYSLLAFPGKISGFIVDTGEKSRFGTLHNFIRALKEKTAVDTTQLSTHQIVSYRSLYGDEIKMVYRAEGLRCEAVINGKIQDWNRYTAGAVYESPYLKVKAGKMWLSDGKHAYTVKIHGHKIQWQRSEP